MLSNHQRKFLRSEAHDLDAQVQIGKEGVGSETVRHIDNILRTRELVKVHVLKTAPEEVREICDAAAEACQAEVVQMVGRRFILYRHSKELAKDGKSLILPRK